GEVSVSHADISAAAEVLGYRRLVTFEAGLERTVKWIAEHRSSGALSP
ncbi:MAG: hypothetical protein JO169_01640, partial [Solirubrobacterales bacterium]|nr:hypothetical protein [Solirubrobacterales bacterium]